jgi:hypothetical protein
MESVTDLPTSSSLIWDPVFRIVIVDAPDPDNPAMVLAALKLASADRPSCDDLLHVVLVGRPIDSQPPISHDMYIRDCARRFTAYLNAHGISTASKVRFYDGGCAECAPIPEDRHDADYLFDRCDLVQRDLVAGSRIVSPSEYRELLSSGFRHEALADRAVSAAHVPLLPLDKLVEHLTVARTPAPAIDLLIGGPLTPCLALFHNSSNSSAGDRLRSRVSHVSAMLAAWTNGLPAGQSKTLLPNQFNVACAPAATRIVLSNDFFPHAHWRLVTTETCKNPEFYVPASAFPHPYSRDLQLLWESTHGGGHQPLFDVLPVIVYYQPDFLQFVPVDPSWDGPILRLSGAVGSHFYASVPDTQPTDASSSIEGRQQVYMIVLERIFS